MWLVCCRTPNPPVPGQRKYQVTGRDEVSGTYRP
jgi:hypothetical protein